MIKRRKRLTEPEVAYLMSQLLDAVMYLHANFVIHRDLKLGNLFLDRNLNIKVGDLGLATRLETRDEKRKTICGTPNYIAPEVIQGDRATRGHSFQVDIWSMGVILYTTLIGKPPYEAKDVKATYQRILANEYSFPKDKKISDTAKDLIRSMLQSKPEDRPSLEQIISHPFFTERAMPVALPSNATHVAPTWEENSFGEIMAVQGSKKKSTRSNSIRRPFASRDVNSDRGSDRGDERSKPPKSSGREGMDVPGAVKSALSAVMNAATRSPPTTTKPAFQVYDEAQASEPGKISSASIGEPHHSKSHHQNSTNDDGLAARTSALSIRSQNDGASASPTSGGMLTHQETDAAVLQSMIDRISTVLDITESRSYSPHNANSLSLTPFTRGGPTKWVTRYVDYTSKYGLGYLLSDGR